MCFVSNVGDAWGRTLPQRHPWTEPYIHPTITVSPPAATKQDIEDLRAEMEELKKLLRAAKRFDEETGQANCEQETKVELIRKIAELVGVDLEDVLS